MKSVPTVNRKIYAVDAAPVSTVQEERETSAIAVRHVSIVPLTYVTVEMAVRNVLMYVKAVPSNVRTVPEICVPTVDCAKNV